MGDLLRFGDRNDEIRVHHHSPTVGPELLGLVYIPIDPASNLITDLSKERLQMSDRVLVPFKPVTSSKIVWVSIVQGIFGVLTVAGVTIPDTWDQATIETWVGGAIATVGGVIAFLRIFKTSEPLAVAGKLPAAPEKKI